MKIRTPRTLLIAASLTFALGTFAQTMEPVDASQSTITWHGSKITGTHHGQLRVQNGEVTTLQGALVGADIVMDMTSITCTDITSEGSNQRLVDHLKSEDFFNCSAYPEATFRTTKVEKLAGSESTGHNYRVTGDLTIKGITHPATFDCTFVPFEDGYRTIGTLTFDRVDYAIKYRSGSIFDDLGDKVIHDEVRLDLDIRTR